jgi:hypothetical protein
MLLFRRMIPRGICVRLLSCPQRGFHCPNVEMTPGAFGKRSFSCFISAQSADCLTSFIVRCSIVTSSLTTQSVPFVADHVPVRRHKRMPRRRRTTANVACVHACVRAWRAGERVSGISATFAAPRVSTTQRSSAPASATESWRRLGGGGKRLSVGKSSQSLQQLRLQAASSSSSSSSRCLLFSQPAAAVSALSSTSTARPQ